MIEEKAVLYRAEKLDNLLLFKAHYHHFAFDRHSHEDFALGLMESGVQTFHCRGEDYFAPPGSMITVNADEIHDGRSADKGDFRYRVLYIPVELMQSMGCSDGASGRFRYFRLPVTIDSCLAGQLAELFRLLDSSSCESLEPQSQFYELMAGLLQRHCTEPLSSQMLCSIPESIDRARHYILDMARENLSLDDLAEVAGLSRYYFLHLFSTSLGITPYALLLQRRLQLARQEISRGASLADAALHAGFADQSHFSRRFKAAYGLTPRQFQRAVR
jgi:AraC-like DNA-binding protein